VAVRFTETMRGFFAFDETDPQRGYDQGRADGTGLSFRLTIETDDVDEFIANLRHQAVANGYVGCDALGGRRPVTDGEFNLFVADDGGTPGGTPGGGRGGALARQRSRNRQMLYRLPFTDAAGHPLTLNGFKVIRDDVGLDLWSDTTTLYTRIYAGHVGLGLGADLMTEPDARIVGAGILRIYPLDFLRQLTTFRADPAGLVGLAGLARFARFFLGELWRVYAPFPSDPVPAAPEPRG
jgi:cholesterol oxidase